MPVPGPPECQVGFVFGKWETDAVACIATADPVYHVTARIYQIVFKGVACCQLRAEQSPVSLPIVANGQVYAGGVEGGSER